MKRAPFQRSEPQTAVTQTRRPAKYRRSGNLRFELSGGHSELRVSEANEQFARASVASEGLISRSIPSPEPQGGFLRGEPGSSQGVIPNCNETVIDLLSSPVQRPFGPRKKGDTYSSARWRSRKKKVLTRNHGKCEKCQARDSFYVHHLWYPPCKLGDEPDEALQAICWQCHAEIHPHRRTQFRNQWWLTKVGCFPNLYVPKHKRQEVYLLDGTPEEYAELWDLKRRLGLIVG